jgi:hypothetical protein
MAFTPKIVTCIRVGDVGSTTNYVTMFQQNRQSREKALKAPGAFSRIRDSARDREPDSNYWHGRIVYIYLASVKWNLKRRDYFTAVSRAAYMAAALIFPLGTIFSSDFWRGALKPHYPRQGLALEASEKELYAETKKNLSW